MVNSNSAVMLFLKIRHHFKYLFEWKIRPTDKRGTCNTQQERSSFMFSNSKHVQKIATSLHFSLRLNLAKRYTDKNTKIVTYLKRTWKKYIYMLVELETTTEIAACVLHDLTAKIIRTPPPIFCPYPKTSAMLYPLSYQATWIDGQL